MSEQTPLLAEGKPSAPPPAQGAPPPYAGGAAPPPPYVQPQAQQTHHTTIIASPPQVTVVRFGDCPVRMTCPNCQNQVLSQMTYVAGSLTWIIVGVLLLLGFWLGCCLIPLCIDGLKDVEHSCPVCNHSLGSYRRL